MCGVGNKNTETLRFKLNKTCTGSEKLQNDEERNQRRPE